MTNSPLVISLAVLLIASGSSIAVYHGLRKPLFWALGFKGFKRLYNLFSFFLVPLFLGAWAYIIDLKESYLAENFYKSMSEIDNQFAICFWPFVFAFAIPYNILAMYIYLAFQDSQQVHSIDDFKRMEAKHESLKSKHSECLSLIHISEPTRQAESRMPSSA